MELSKSKFNIFASLGSAKMRKKHRLFTVEGEKSVSDTINSFDVEAIVCVKGNIFDFSLGHGPVYEVSTDEMRRLSNLTTPSSVMAVYKLPESDHSAVKHIGNGLYVLLDGIQDPGNLGTIVRTCHWFGIFTIFASKDTVDIYNPKTVQSTMGSISKVEIVYCDLEKLLEENPDMPVYGTFLDGKNIFATKLEKRGFIVMGNEGKGISDKLRKHISQPLFIPPATSDHGESLNVAVATAITIAQFQK